MKFLKLFFNFHPVVSWSFWFYIHCFFTCLYVWNTVALIIMHDHSIVCDKNCFSSLKTVIITICCSSVIKQCIWMFSDYWEKKLNFLFLTILSSLKLVRKQKKEILWFNVLFFLLSSKQFSSSFIIMNISHYASILFMCWDIQMGIL